MGKLAIHLITSGERWAIALTFILVGLGSFQSPVRGAYVFIENYIDAPIFGVVMFITAVWVLYSTYKKQHLAVACIMPFFAYVGGIFGLLFFTNIIVPPQTIGAYFLAAYTVLLAAIRGTD